MRRVVWITDGDSWEGFVFVKNCLNRTLLVYVLDNVKKILIFFVKYVRIVML